MLNPANKVPTYFLNQNINDISGKISDSGRLALCQLNWVTLENVYYGDI